MTGNNQLTCLSPGEWSTIQKLSDFALPYGVTDDRFFCCDPVPAWGTSTLHGQVTGAKWTGSRLFERNPELGVTGTPTAAYDESSQWATYRCGLGLPR